MNATVDKVRQSKTLDACHFSALLRTAYERGAFTQHELGDLGGKAERHFPDHFPHGGLKLGSRTAFRNWLFDEDGADLPPAAVRALHAVMTDGQRTKLWGTGANATVIFPPSRKHGSAVEHLADLGVKVAGMQAELARGAGPERIRKLLAAMRTTEALLEVALLNKEG
jgi:hypothetical protein